MNDRCVYIYAWTDHKSYANSTSQKKKKNSTSHSVLVLT